ncbi:hypothetical protein [Cronobacter phage JC01]|uniref:Uncharacterized protein n=1 Tax=Cronobacter phage JC01 TaxID=2729575 RepID=A0A6M3YL18_9CAUD|nr:hypothetical protein JT331_gp34 [Cronobacter phage JC01]QJI52252.1 hypothetical protein [Cronobacter phage JC01]
MGVTLMENFDCDVGALVERGWVMPATTTNVFTAIEQFTENGITRNCFRHSMSMSYYGFGAFYPFRIPLPASKEFFVSFRMRYPNASRINSSTAWSVSTNSGRSAANLVLEVYPADAYSSVYLKNNGQVAGSPSYRFNHQTWATIEMQRKADGSTKVWVDDMLLYSANANTTASADNYLYMGVVNAGQGSTIDGYQIADVVVIDPTTAGLQNRPGSSERVLSLAASADVLAQWTAIGGATEPHNQLMKNYPATVDTTKVLQGDTAGQREQYSLADFPAGFGTQLLTLGFEQRANNPGSSPHVFTTEVDLGAGPVGVADNTVAPGATYSYRPVYVASKPGGGTWTAADIPALKIGFSVKS